jgi:hypothetical protein
VCECVCVSVSVTEHAFGGAGIKWDNFAIKKKNRDKAGGAGMKWGNFSRQLPGRCGYQCSNYYLYLQQQVPGTLNPRA